MLGSRWATRWRRNTLAVLLVASVSSLALTACTPDRKPDKDAEFVGMLAVDPDSAFGLPKPLGLTPKLQDETVVLDEAATSTISSVTVVDPEGCAPADPDRHPCEFVIAFSSPPHGVEVGSVLVAGVSPQTPGGLLVTVTGFEGSTVLAVEAGLGDALEQGDGSVEKQFTAADIGTQTLAPGVSALGSAAVHRIGEAKQGPGDKEFNFAIDHVQIADGVYADGVASFDMGCGAYAGVSWEEYFGIPVYPNGVYFEAKCGASQSGSITVSATKTVQANYSKQIANFTLDPITFYVIVPIVFVPHITVSVAANGNLKADMSFGAAESFSANVGINYSDGFNAIKDFGYDASSPTATGSARLSAEASVTVGESLLLYDIAGPAMSETLYVRLKGAAAGESPLWCIRGGLRADASLVLETEVKNLNWGPEQLFDIDKELGCAENSAPTLKIDSPGAGIYYPHDGPFPPTFSVTAPDPEDGYLEPVWTSSVDGELGTGTLVNPPLSLGTHIITATVTDSGGLTVSQSVTIQVTELKPQVSFQVKGSNGVWQSMTSLAGKQGDILYFRVVSKHDVSLMIEDCADVSFSGGLPVSKVAQCDYGISLSQQGSHTVTATVVDSNGKAGSAPFSVSVAPPPLVVTPKISTIDATKTSPSPSWVVPDGYSVNEGNTVSLHASYVNQSTAKVVVRYEWWVRNSATGTLTLILGTDSSPSTGSYRNWIAPNGGGTYVVTAYMFNKSTGVVADKNSFTIVVEKPIK